MSGEGLRKKLTPLEVATFESIREHLNEFGYGPTLRGIAEELGASVSGVENAVGHLVRLKRIRRVPGIHRGIVEVID